MRDLRIVVEEIRGFCDLPMRPGDYFDLRGGRISIPEGKHICLYALSALLPLLPAKQRTGADPNDWMPRVDRVVCPDPDGQVVYRIDSLDGEPPAPPKRRLLLDEDLCQSCGVCLETCKETEASGGMSRVQMIEGLPHTCRQCGIAPCVQACAHGALHRDPATVAVQVNEELCQGCGECAAACAFDGIRMHAGHPLTCHLCGGEPECVKACPHDALRYGFGREKV